MRVTKKSVLATLGSAAALTTIMAAPVFADTTSAEITNEESTSNTAVWTDKAAANVQSYANIRLEANTDSESVGVLLPGHMAEVISNDGNWSRIKSGNVEGYIRDDLLVFGEEARAHYTNVCGLSGTVEAEGLRIRAQASTDSRILAVTDNGSKLKVLGTQDDWYHIDYNGESAFVKAEYLKLDELNSVAMSTQEFQAKLQAEAAEKAAAEKAEAEKAAAAEKVAAEKAEAVAGKQASSPDVAAENQQAELPKTEQTKAQEPAANVGNGDLDLLAALIQCEAGGESRTGKVAVGAVVVNRVNSGSFPNSINDVVYQGGQFSPVTNGSLSRTLASGARSDCYEAAKAALNGESPIGNSLYFNNGSGKGTQIGNQHFY